MTTEQEPIQEAAQQLDPGGSLLGLFDTVSFRERIAKIRYGLKQPEDSGDYKWAIFELKRFMSPTAAVVVPMIALLLLVIFAALNHPDKPYVVKIIDTRPPPELDPIKAIIEPPPVIQDPVKVDFEDVVVSDVPTPTPPTDFSPQPAVIDSVAIKLSPVRMRGIYRSRTPGNIGEVTRRNPGSGTEGAVMAALRWLKTKQHYDGYWPQTKPAMTALAILAYLAHGETPSSEEFGDTVERAIRFLVGAQTGDGRFSGKDDHDYTQPIAAYALSEAYGMTRVPQLKYAAEKAIDVVIKGQNPSGAFNYNLVPGGSDRNDTTYTSWCVQALKAAQMAGLENEGLAECMRKAVGGVKTNYGANGDGYGGFGYTSSGSGGLDGAGVLCLQFLGDTKSAEYRNAMNGLAQWDFNWDERKSGSPVYYWYYVTQAQFQHGGDTWNSWNRKFSPTLVKKQNLISKEQSGYKDHTGEPRAIGSWNSPSPNEHTGGNKTVMDTILCTLQLEVYYRYLPTFQTIEIGKEVDIVKDEENVDVSIRL